MARPGNRILLTYEPPTSISAILYPVLHPVRPVAERGCAAHGWRPGRGSTRGRGASASLTYYGVAGKPLVRREPWYSDVRTLESIASPEATPRDAVVGGSGSWWR